MIKMMKMTASDTGGIPAANQMMQTMQEMRVLEVVCQI
jgi:hypothetical protein